jgi:hypothetical protein
MTINRTLNCGENHWNTTFEFYEENSETAGGLDSDRASVRYSNYRYSRVDVSRQHHQNIRKSGEISQRNVRRPRRRSRRKARRWRSFHW